MIISGLKLGNLIEDSEDTDQGKIAKLLGKTRQTINAWTKRASVEVTKAEAEKLAKALKVSLQDLTDENGGGRSFRDEIFEGDYIGLHKKVWEQMEANMILHRDVIRDLVKKLPHASNE